LVSTTEARAVVGDAKLNPDVQGLLVKFCLYLEKEAYSDENDYPKLLAHLARIGADLHDPESVKAVIAQMKYTNRHGEVVKCKNGTKMLYCAAYSVFADMLKIAWSNPGYRQEEIEVYVPYETELDALIASARSRRMVLFCRLLKRLC
jgi:hypothetical protein